jgi:hypothetical protein
VNTYTQWRERLMQSEDGSAEETEALVGMAETAVTDQEIGDLAFFIEEDEETPEIIATNDKVMAALGIDKLIRALKGFGSTFFKTRVVPTLIQMAKGDAVSFDDLIKVAGIVTEKTEKAYLIGRLLAKAETDEQVRRIYSLTGVNMPVDLQPRKGRT